MKRVSATAPYEPPSGEWVLVADYRPESPNYMRWYWECDVGWAERQGVLG